MVRASNQVDGVGGPCDDRGLGGLSKRGRKIRGASIGASLVLLTLTRLGARA